MIIMLIIGYSMELCSTKPMTTVLQEGQQQSNIQEDTCFKHCNSDTDCQSSTCHKCLKSFKICILSIGIYDS